MSPAVWEPTESLARPRLHQGPWGCGTTPYPVALIWLLVDVLLAVTVVWCCSGACQLHSLNADVGVGGQLSDFIPPFPLGIFKFFPRNEPVCDLQVGLGTPRSSLGGGPAKSRGEGCGAAGLRTALPSENPQPMQTGQAPNADLLSAGAQGCSVSCGTSGEPPLLCHLLPVSRLGSGSSNLGCSLSCASVKNVFH